MVSLGHINKPFHFSFSLIPGIWSCFESSRSLHKKGIFILWVLRLREEEEEEEEEGGLRPAHDVVAWFEECKSFFLAMGYGNIIFWGASWVQWRRRRVCCCYKGNGFGMSSVQLAHALKRKVQNQSRFLTPKRYSLFPWCCKYMIHQYFFMCTVGKFSETNQYLLVFLSVLAN